MQKCVTRYELQDFVVMSLVDCSEPTIAGEHLVVARRCVMAKEGSQKRVSCSRKAAATVTELPLSSGGCVSVAMLRLLLKAIG